MENGGMDGLFLELDNQPSKFEKKETLAKKLGFLHLEL
ncbi:hypothetical protein LEP1GSC199_3190 [Leptospira vanthielii serovar Holland str. Waz Holland = ATCC 700522]|uniref:Uncharacterized protein n=1 Tax=Leptospira vanthielii serovar Holland str. Waz Holland = ATCC 700522 TaxID=1218591 RepID=N1WEH5_9LEPT|nr:hypothetical protein LEP1GSC199_3190 [Leptospira vanthielii serovar Holland str. Waz Holland = ATCC 700522]